VVPVTLSRGGPADIDALEPVWVAVHRRHVDAMPELAPYVDDATTWRERRRLYVELLARPGTVLVVARAEGAVVGYGLAHVLPVRETWLADTWRTGERIGEIESVGVLPGHRGRGLGTRLLDALEDELAAAGVDDLIVGALAGNSGAIRLYERRGYRPTWTYLSRLAQRDPPP
jgi:ribosomal protein S18 acetylase RimI-like enzyme